MRSQLTENEVSAEPLPTTATSSVPLQRVFLLDQNVLELRPSTKQMVAFAFSLLLIGIAASLYICFFTEFEERKNISLFVAAFFLAGALGTLGASILIHQQRLLISIMSLGSNCSTWVRLASHENV